jgi:hypothetical protein
MIRSTWNEQQAVSQINRDLTGLKPGEVIGRDTAQLIAAAVHRGVSSELKHFAETGVIKHHQLARLELFYTVKDELKFIKWANALRDYITMDQREHKHGGAR